MQEEEINKLLELRQDVVSNVKSAAMSDNEAGPDRLRIIMELIRSGDSDVGLFKAAYDIAKNTENNDDRIQSLLDILFEIDQAIGRNEPNQQEIFEDKAE